MKTNSVPTKTKPATGVFVQRDSGDAPKNKDVLAYAKQSGPKPPFSPVSGKKI